MIQVQTLIAAGATRAEIRRATEPLTRLAKGTYGDVSALDPGSSHLLRARAHLTRLASVTVSHTSAAALWDLPTRHGDLDLVHFSPLVGRPGNPKAGAGYHVHFREVPDDEMTVLGELPLTTPLRTVLDCATALPGDWGVAVADAALHRGLISRTALAQAAGATRRIKGAQRVRMLPTRCSPLAESPGESLLRLQLHRMGLDVREQVSLPDIEGRPRVDFLVEGGLVIEFDGRSKYGIDGDPERAHWEEKLRHDRLTEAGFEVLRIVWADLWDEAALTRRVMRALARARRRGTSASGARPS